jgi:hypothetical protein
MDMWKRAVIHLECATDSEHFYDRIKRIDLLRKELERGQITHEQYAEQIGSKTRDIRFHGTAFLIEHYTRRYMITARHVLWDEHSSKREYQEEENKLQDLPEQMRVSMLENAKEYELNKIFNIIFRVPSLDEKSQNNFNPVNECLMNLGAGTSSSVPYTFSKPEYDLAVVSLDQRDEHFANELVNKGYNFISSNHIAESPSKEGAKVYTIGFPESMSIQGELILHPAETHWSSSDFSLPITSFGRVSMLHKSLPFFWADMSIYPGNSGGPLVEEDNVEELVGIVSGQPTIPVENNLQLRTRIPFARIIKAKYILELISQQEEKDNIAGGNIMGTKGRKNVKKPKQNKGKKAEAPKKK